MPFTFKYLVNAIKHILLLVANNESSTGYFFYIIIICVRNRLLKQSLLLQVSEVKSKLCCNSFKINIFFANSCKILQLSVESNPFQYLLWILTQKLTYIICTCNIQYMMEKLFLNMLQGKGPVNPTANNLKQQWRTVVMVRKLLPSYLVSVSWP